MVIDLGRKLDRIAKEGLKDLRKLLPAGRGGSGPKLGKDGEIIAKTVRQKERIPLRTTSIPAAPAPSIGRRFAESAALRKLEETPGGTNMNREEAIMTVVNDPMVEITPAMLPIINDPSIMMDLNGDLVRNQFAEQFRRDVLEPKPKRKVSKYQKELGRQLKMLKKKHPRTKVTALMKRAHRLTRKALK